jgi:hypothetical protein
MTSRRRVRAAAHLATLKQCANAYVMSMHGRPRRRANG